MRILVIGALVAVFTGCFRGDPAPPTHPPTTPTARPMTRGAAIADPLGFLPADAEMVLVIDMKPVRVSPLWQRFEPMLRQRTNQFLAIFATACKFDPIESLRWISIGIRDLTATSPTGAFVIRGFDRELVMKCIELARMGDPTAITIDEGIVTIGGTSQSALTFVDATTLVAIVGPNANANTLRGVLDGGAPLRLTPWINELLPKIDTKDPAWFVLDGNSKLLAGSGFGTKARGVMGSMNLVNGVGGSFRMRLDAPDQATNLVATMQGQIGPVAGFFDELAITADDTDVVVRVRATTSQIEMILSLAGVP
jgi:hypothetical protein